MPPVVTCEKTSCRNEWNVGSDDFVVPALIAIVVGFFNLSLILAVIFALYYVPGVTVGFPSPSPSPSLSLNSTCANATSYSPLLYAPLFSLAVAEIGFILNEFIILCLSAQGPVIKETKSFRCRVRFMPPLIYLRIVLAVFELLSIIASIVGLYHPLAVSSLDGCEPLDIRLKLARAVVFLQVFFYFLFLIKVCIYTDPLGCSTPGLLERLSLLDKNDARESLLLSSSSEFTEEASQRRKMMREVSADELSSTREVAVWTKRNKLFSLNKDDISKVSQIHNDSISRKKIERKLRTIFCCLGVRGQKSRGVALEDVARGLYTVFSEMNIVLSDVIAGFSLLREHQKMIRKDGGGDLALTQKFRMITFKMMPRQQWGPICNSRVLRPDTPFNFEDWQNQLVFEDLVHYMNFAMGVYGWPLHVFDNLTCGVCELCKVTCCRFRCLHKRVRNKEFREDNCCMCGVGTMRLRTKIKEDDILFVSFQNMIYLAPFMVCLDEKKKSVVICIRGTLSLKDTLTDMSFSPIFNKIKGVKETYIHGGMLRAAREILNTIRKEEILKKAFKEHPGYRLVVTGHSLGAGVASALALLIKLEMQYSDDMIKCYAFSPPGALFSFPLAEYSSSFITSVVLGNDIVPRITLRALLHLKFSVKQLLESSEKPKYQILCKSRTCATLCQCVDKSKEVVKSSRRPSHHRRSTSKPYAIKEGHGTSETRGQVSSEAGGQTGIELGEGIGLEVAGQTGIELERREGRQKVEEQVSIVIEPPEEDTVFTETAEGLASGGDQSESGSGRGVASEPGVVVRRVSVDSEESDVEDISLEEKDSIEWQVFNSVISPEHKSKKLTTASLRQALFQKSRSVEPESLSFPGRSLDNNLRPSTITSDNAPRKGSAPAASLPRMTHPPSNRPFIRRQSSVAHTLAVQIKKAVSFELADEFSSFDSYIQGTDEDIESSLAEIGGTNQASSPESSSQQNTAVASFVRVSSDSSGEETPKVESSQDSERRLSDLTPDGVMHHTVPKLLQFCRADESREFVPFFPPGRMLHIQMKRKDGCCGVNDYKVMEVNRENMCVILIDEGMVDDHLPNHVLAALKACKDNFMSSPNIYKSEEIKAERERAETLLTQIRQLKRDHFVCPKRGFLFGGEGPMKDSPMKDPPTGSHLGGVAAGKRKNVLKKQRSFDVDEGLPKIPEVAEDSISGQLDIVVEADINQESASSNENVSETTADQASRIDSGIQNSSVSDSEATIQSQSQSITTAVEVPTPNSVDGPDDVFSSSLKKGGEGERQASLTKTKTDSLSSSPRMGLKLDLSLSGSAESLGGGSRLRERRNISNEALRLTIPPANEAATPM